MPKENSLEQVFSKRKRCVSLAESCISSRAIWTTLVQFNSAKGCTKTIPAKAKRKKAISKRTLFGPRGGV